MTALRFYSRKLFAAWVYPDCVRTVFYDGSETIGRPPEGDAFLESARVLGYGDDTYWHMIEHDLCHAFLAERLDGAPSAALWAQAHDQDAWQKPPAPGAERDEGRVGNVQAALNGKAWAMERLSAQERLAVPTLRGLLRPAGVAMTREWAKSARPEIVLPLAA